MSGSWLTQERVVYFTEDVQHHEVRALASEVLARRKAEADLRRRVGELEAKIKRLTDGIDRARSVSS